jgi:hypothetical protein
MGKGASSLFLITVEIPQAISLLALTTEHGEAWHEICF